MTDPETHRLNFVGQLGRLLIELDTWQGELRLDVARAEQRGLWQLASDLRRLNRRVDSVLHAGRWIARRGGDGSV